MTRLNQLDQPIETLGHQLARPECILTNAQGEIFVSDFRGGVTGISPNGEQTFWGGEHADIGLLQTNGFALLLTWRLYMPG